MAHSVRLAPSQVDYLNLVRAAAAQIVLFGHASHYYFNGRLLASGRLETLGVLVFFLLSGFLICTSVLQKWERTDYRFGHYVIDRFCRIFSAYVPALVFVAAVDGMLRSYPDYPYGDSYTPGTWLGNLAMLQDYPVFQVLRRLGAPEQPWFIRPFGSGRPFWTVAIEWWIYLFFGYLAFFTLRGRPITAQSLLILGLLGVIPIYNAMGGVGDCLSFVWAFGAGVALLWHRLCRWTAARDGIMRNRRLAFLCGVGIALSAALLGGRVFVTGFRVYDLQFAIFAGGILFGTLFLLGFAPFTLPNPMRRAIDFVADYSYSLYLIHYTILIFFALRYPSATLHDPGMFLVVLLSANLCAVLFWFVFERHYHAIAQSVKGIFDRRRLRMPAPEAEPPATR